MRKPINAVMTVAAGMMIRIGMSGWLASHAVA
jgi:hypothetical protein